MLLLAFQRDRNWLFFFCFSLSRLVTKDCDYQSNMFKLKIHSHCSLLISLLLKLTVTLCSSPSSFIYRHTKQLPTYPLASKQSSQTQVAAKDLLERRKNGGATPAKPHCSGWMTGVVPHLLKFCSLFLFFVFCVFFQKNIFD